MKIYVAGTVLRDRLEGSILRSLTNLYKQIVSEARLQGHSVDIPYPDVALDQMTRERFAAEIQRRILHADSVITVLYPPNPNVAFEAHFAAENHKPQVLVVDPAQRPELSPSLAHLARYSIWEVKIQEVIFTLEMMVRHSRDEPQSESSY
jgi:hypothetical protein